MLCFAFIHISRKKDTWKVYEHMSPAVDARSAVAIKIRKFPPRIIEFPFLYLIFTTRSEVCCLLAGPWTCGRKLVFFFLSLYLTDISEKFYLKKNHHSLSPFRLNDNTVVFPFPFHIFMPLANLCSIRLQG